MAERLTTTTRRGVTAGAGTAAALGLLVGTAPVHASIDLELRAQAPVEVGQTAEIELYAVSDSAAEQAFFSMEVVLVWDPTVLRMLPHEDDAVLDLDQSGFPNGVHGLNEADPPQDGDALYVGVTSGFELAAPDEGTRVATLRFEVLRAVATEVDIVPIAGDPPGWTVVWDATVPGLWVTGALEGTEVPIVGAATPCEADTDGNDLVDVLDLLQVLAEWGGPSASSDLDDSGAVDVLDLLIVLGAWGPCAP